MKGERSSLSRRTLARAALALNARSGFAGLLPALVLMTDEKRLPDPLGAARALPKGSAIVVRHTKPRARAELARKLAGIARERGLILLIAGDAKLADEVHADGLHLSEARLAEASYWRTRRPHWLITVAAHSAPALRRAGLAGAHAAFLAPVFPTTNHPTRAALGPCRFVTLANHAALPVYALGGITAANVGRLVLARAAGIAAVEALKA
jgi:thiamine-phosphate pyrophosphorylase